MNINSYQVTYHLVSGEKFMKNIPANDERELQSELITKLEFGEPTSFKTSFDTIVLVPVSAILYFEIKEL